MQSNLIRGRGRYSKGNVLLLEKQKFLDTDDQEKARELVTEKFGASRFEVVARSDAFHINSSLVKVNSVSLLRSRSTAGIETGFCESDFFRQYFVLRGSSNTVLENGTELCLSTNVSGVVDPGHKISVHTSANLDHMILRIEKAALRRKLASLLNTSVDQAPLFGGVINLGNEVSRRMRKAVTTLAFDVESFGVLVRISS